MNSITAGLLDSIYDEKTENLTIPEHKIQLISEESLTIYSLYYTYDRNIGALRITENEEAEDLVIPEHKIYSIDEDSLDIYNIYSIYSINKENLEIIDADLKNRYTIDLEHFWFSEYEDNKLSFELRKCINKYEKIRTEFHVKSHKYGAQLVKYRDRNLRVPKTIITTSSHIEIKDTAIRYDIAIRNINISCYEFNDNDLLTDWGDNIIDKDIDHIYENGIYDIVTTGTIDTERYIHTGKDIVTIDNIRRDIIDASWLFAECYYAEDSTFFPIVNSADMENMNHMFYHCPRLKELDLSEYDTLAVKDISHMFDSCISLEKLNLNNWTLPLVQETDCMLMNCINLKELRLDNCSRLTIEKVIESKYFPTNVIGSIDEGEINDAKFDSTTKDFHVPDYMIQECSNARITIEDKYTEYDPVYKALLIAYMLGNIRKIYCKKENIVGLNAPKNWTFEHNLSGIKDVVRYDAVKENLYIPDYMIDELADDTYLFDQYVNHNEDNMDIHIS